MAKIPYSLEYEYVWKHYPRRWVKPKGVDRPGKWVKPKKYEGWLVWQKLDEEDQKDIILKARYLYDHLGTQPPDIPVFLRNRRWDDIDYSKKYQPIWPEECSKDIGHSDVFKPVDTNLQRTINLRKLGHA